MYLTMFDNALLCFTGHFYVSYLHDIFSLYLIYLNVMSLYKCKSWWCFLLCQNWVCSIILDFYTDFISFVTILSFYCDREDIYVLIIFLVPPWSSELGFEILRCIPSLHCVRSSVLLLRLDQPAHEIMLDMKKWFKLYHRN